ncbi:hypothetical protein MD484_g2178, partial [Candolleomyces efflorescens]
MPLSRLPLPSFSLVLTAANGDPLLTMEDFNPALSSVELNLQLPQLSGIVTPPTLLQPRDHDPLMHSVDTRFQGQLAYKARYATEAGNPKNEDDDDRSETGTVYEPYPGGLANALRESDPTRRPQRRPARGKSPGLLNRLNVKFSTLWRKIYRLGASIFYKNV